MRIAGNNPGYTFRLCRTGKGGEVLETTDEGFDLPSVTTILGDVLGKPAGAMAWWGFRVGLAGVTPLLGTGALDDVNTAEELEELVRAAGYDPNVSTDSASSRGQQAHDVLELLANGEREQAEKTAAQEVETTGNRYCEAVISWWDAQSWAGELASNIVRSETRLWSLRHGYAGTTDLVAPIPADPSRGIEQGVEILDLKTHKPASGFTKPGSGPAYISDLLQVRAYRIAWEEMGLGPTVGNRIVIARDNGKWLEDRREVDPQMWFAVLEAHRLKQAFEEGA